MDGRDQLEAIIVMRWAISLAIVHCLNDPGVHTAEFILMLLKTALLSLIYGRLSKVKKCKFYQLRQGFNLENERPTINAVTRGGTKTGADASNALPSQVRKAGPGALKFNV